MKETSLKVLEYNKIIKLLTAKAGSSLGKEKIINLLPSSNYKIIEESLNETAEALLITTVSDNIPLGGIRDLKIILKKANIGAMLEANEFLNIAGTLSAAKKIKKFFKELDLEATLLKTWAAKIEVLTQLEQQIENSIDEHGNLLDSASVELGKLRREIRTSQLKIKEKLDAILRSSEYQKYFQDSLVTLRGDRYVIPIKQEYRQFFPGIVHDQSSSGATLFIEPMSIIDLNNTVKELMANEKHEIERILKALAIQVLKYEQQIRLDMEILGHFDFVFAKAKFALEFQASRPEINNDGLVELKQARHPLIPPEKVVPIDILLGKDFSTLLITGPNTGGKTVTLKTLGLFVLMAQAGLFIPAQTGSKLPVYNNVFADIGDEQSIEQSLSTFSSHMTKLIRILDVIKAGDLFLVDEIGSGTDPQEGAALAMAILDVVQEAGIATVATTHYSELKSYAYNRCGVENASVEFDLNSLRPTYKLLIGIPGSSNAFSISTKLGLSAEIIDKANEFLSKEHLQFEYVLAEMEKQKLMYAELNEDLAKREAEIVVLEQRLKNEKENINDRKNRIITKAEEEKANIIRKTKREVEQIISELKEQFDDHGMKERQRAIEAARKELKEKTKIITPEEYKSMPALEIDKVKIGDSVFVTTLNAKATVREIKGKSILVELGLMKTMVSSDVCRKTSTDNKSVITKPKKISLNKIQEVQPSIDIRGVNVQEGEDILNKYLDDVILCGLTRILVIHGKGTGALKKGIRNFLQNHSCVEKIEIAELNEGGDGATVVFMK